MYSVRPPLMNGCHHFYEIAAVDGSLPNMVCCRDLVVALIVKRHVASNPENIGNSTADWPVLGAVTNLEALGERRIKIDCDVIQADGGTRTGNQRRVGCAAHRLRKITSAGAVTKSPLTGQVAAIPAAFSGRPGA